MDTAIRNILVPTGLEQHSFFALEHAANLAALNNAVIHLLHIEAHPLRTALFTKKSARKQKLKIIQQWKSYIENNYAVPIVEVFRKGNIARQVHLYASQQNIDFIMLGIRDHWNWLDIFFERTAKKILRTSNNIPVLTLLNGKQLSQWQHIIIPVSNFIPEKRIRAILNLAITNHFKLHFVTLPGKTKGEKFDVLLDSLKLVKLFGNIPVECKILHGNDIIDSTWKYAASIGADAILMDRNKKETPRLKAIMQNSPYETAFIKTFQPLL